MTEHRFTLFETELGWCALAWSRRGVAGVQLPEASAAATRARLLERFAEACEAAPPPEIRLAVEGISALFRGEARDLAAIPLDLERVPPFHARVYALARTIAPGQTLSYGEVAARLDKPKAARAVGQAMARNPVPILVPCHRVLAADGKMCGFSAPGGVATKRRLLALEGAPQA